MILFLPPCLNPTPRKPITLNIGEVEDYDFTESAKQIYVILQTLQSCNLIYECPYKSPEEVNQCIQMLVDDIDFDSDDIQLSEYKYIRVEYRDELLSLEVFVGV